MEQAGVNRVLETAVHCMLVKQKFYPHEVRVSDTEKKSEEKEVKASASKKRAASTDAERSPAPAKRTRRDENADQNHNATSKASGPVVLRAALTAISGNTTTTHVAEELSLDKKRAKRPRGGERACVFACALLVARCCVLI